MKRIDDHDISLDILNTSHRLGHIPSASEYTKHGKFSLPTLYARRSWNEWLLILFPDYTVRKFPGQGRGKASRDDLLSELRRICGKMRKIPSSLELQKESCFPLYWYLQEFGSISNALDSIGISRFLSKKKIVDNICHVAMDIKRVPRQKEFLSRSCTVKSSASLLRLFGSWNNALLESGLKPRRCRKADPADVVSAVNEWLDHNGGDIACLRYWTIAKAKKRGKFPYAANTVKACFGGCSWEEAMRLCGVEYDVQDQFSKRGSFRGKDGKTYLSMMEKDAADELLSMVDEKIILGYDYERKVCKGRKWTCDFVVRAGNELWMEIDGMGKSRYIPYNEGNEKIEYYKKNGFNYTIITGMEIKRKVHHAILVFMKGK